MTRVESSLRSLALCAFAIATLVACPGPQYPNCSNDSNCHQGEFCVNGRCQQCRPNSHDCPNGRHCVQGRCEQPEGFCAADRDCPNGQRCRQGRCVVSSVTTGHDIDTNAAGGCQLAPIYFDYDSSDIDAQSRAILETNAQCIQQRNFAQVQVTAHTDPRGTEEYNLALGDRRARSVQTYLGRLGVDDSHIHASSMGEEMATGTDDASWARDRRVEFTGH